MMNQRPNILFILTDQQRVDTLKAYGGDVCQTPNLDRLANQSVIFNRAYCSYPVCTPARASLQTGLYPHNHGMANNTGEPGCSFDELPDGPYLLSRQLEKQGYSVGYTGKWHLGSGSINRYTGEEYIRRASPTSRGFEGDDFPGHGGGGIRYPEYHEYLDEKGIALEYKNKITGHYQGHWAAELVSGEESSVEYYLAEQTIDYLEQFRKREQPFFFELNFWGPHEPYIAPTKYLDLYRDMDLEPWPNFHDTGKDKPCIHNAKRSHYTEWKDFEPFVKHYYAFMSLIDAQIGRVIQYLKEHDLYDNTVIIFSTDHGESLGIHGGLCDKNFFMYDEITRIPLMVKPTGQSDAMVRESRFVGSCDIYSTILDMAGIPLEECERDGKSFYNMIRGKEISNWPDAIVTESFGLSHILYTQRMIRKGDIKYVFNCGDTDELYDLAKDPYEMVNEVNNPEYQEALLDMKESLIEWMKEKKDRALGQYMLLRTR